LSTIRAVAKAAGVSKTTVSFVMNNARPQVDRIPVETRDRIKACAAALGYSSNPIAASLRTGRRVWIGVMSEVLPEDSVSWAWAPFFEVSALYGIQRKLAENGYFTLLGLRSVEDEVHDMEILVSAQVGGLILRAADERAVEKAEELRASGVPVVNLFPRRPGDLYPHTVDLDNLAAGRLAAELVIKCGSKNPAFITVPRISHALRNREEGFVTTIREQLGTAPGKCELALKPNGGMVNGGLSHGQLSTLFREGRPDVVVALDAGTSMVLNSFLHDPSVVIPENLAVIGFDAVVCGNSRYQRLSSVGVSWVRGGEAAAQIVVDQVENREAGPLPRLLPPVFVPGDSTPPHLCSEHAVETLTHLTQPAGRSRADR